jgi:type I restriction enzyme S subunit
MANEWKRVTIGEVAERVAMGPFGSSIKVSTFVEKGIPVISGQHLRGSRLEDSEFNFVSEEHAGALKNANVFRGDVVFTHAGNIGQCAYIPATSKYSRYVLSQRQFYVRCDRSKVLPEFITCFFKSAEGRHALLANASQTGVPSIARPVTYVRTIEIPLPNLAEQKAIAAALGALDDKIELNRRMNATLEAMVRALFKSWFVDFDPVRAKLDGRTPAALDPATAALFPDSFDDSALGHIPKGWEVKTIEELAERVAMGPFGSDIKVSTFVPEGIPVVSGQHLRGTLLDDSEFNFVSVEHADRLKRSNVQCGDVIFTHAGSIGQVAYIPEASRYDRYIVSQRQFYMRCNRALVSPFYITSYFKTPEGQHRLLANTSSTGVPSISQPVTYLRQLKMVVPPPALLKVFDTTVGQIHLKMADNDHQSRTLATLRDTLLPKLLSGELAV